MPGDKKLLIGNRYKIVRRLSWGGSGEVYLAEDITKDVRDNLCAVKVLAPRTRDPNEYAIFCERFKDEATYLRALNGFNRQIPKLYDYFSEPDGNDKETHYIVQEYIEGKTLRDKILEGGNLPESKVAEILASLLPVIGHIHSKGFIHRDINPANIILRNHDELPVLIDFGAVKDVETTIISASESDDDPLTVVIGKTGYMAPEHLAGRPVFASDLYSLGVTTIEALSGSKPRDLDRDSNKHRLLWRHQVPGISNGLAAVIDRAVHKHVEQRYPDARSMLEALESVVIPGNDNSLRLQLGVSPFLFGPLRQPSASGRLQKCWEETCSYYLVERDEYCPNCGAYNLDRFNDDEVHLMCHSVEEHFQRFFQRRRESSVISIARRIRGDNDIEWIAMLLTSISALIIAVLVGGLLSGSVFGFIDSLFDYGWFSLVGIIAVSFLSTGSIWLLPNLILLNETRRLNELSQKRDRLRSKLKGLTATYRNSGSYLNWLEKETQAQLGNTSKREKSIRERLLYTEMTATEVFEAKDIKNEIETLKSALEKCQLKQKKYEVKLLEIKLLRLHNQLQAMIDRQRMSGEGRSKLEVMLESLYKQTNRMFNSMKKANILNSTDGEEWGARIFRARDLATKSHNLLMSQINDSMLRGRENDFIAPPEELLENLDLLNSYITYEDFLKEYQALQSE